MTISFARAYSLVARGAAGLACDDEGVALGPMPLVESVSDASGRRCYRMRSAEEVTQAFRLAYGSAPDEIERYRRGLAEVTQLLAAGEGAQARIQAVLLAVPEIAPEGMAKLAQAATHCERTIPTGRTSHTTPLAFPKAANGRVTKAGNPRMRLSIRQRAGRTMCSRGRNALLTRI
jgi:hypothetical protein